MADFLCHRVWLCGSSISPSLFILENFRKLSITFENYRLSNPYNWKKDYVFEAKRLDVWARRTGRLGQNVVTFEPKIRVFWPEISVPFCGEGGGVIKNACVRICVSLRVRACATPRHTSASEGGSTVMSQKKPLLIIKYLRYGCKG